MRWYPTDGNLNTAQTQFYYGDQTSSVCFFSFGLLLKKKKRKKKKEKYSPLIRAYPQVDGRESVGQLVR